MKKKLFLALTVFLLSAIIFSTTVNAKNVNDFIDVHENDWFYATVKDVAEKELMTGLSETTFGPSELLARGQFACVLYRMEGSPEISYETIYPDVADGQFYSDAITWANKSGTITGYENGLYGVADNITREQLVTIMYRYAKASGRENVSEKVDLSGYPDSNKVTAFAKEAMQWAVATGVIKGDGVTGELQPQGNVSRAVCATIISRYTDKGHTEENEAAKLYEAVIEDYRRAAESGFQGDAAMYPYVSPHLFDELFMQPIYADRTMYYALVDLCEDGVPELLLAFENGGFEQGYDILDVYGHDGYNPKRIVMEGGGPYQRYYACENGIIRKNWISGGRSAVGELYFQLSPNSVFVQKIADIYRDGYGTFHDQTEKNVEITKEEYEAIKNQYSLKNDIEWILLI